MEKKIDVEWYAENYTPWIDDINSYEDLEKFWANLNPRYKRRFDHWFRDIELNGVILELGFNNGKTLKWLNDRYSNIYLYGIDFNKNLEKISPYLRSIEQVSLLGIFDFDKKNRTCEDTYHHIMCLNFIEHLYYEDYLASIDTMKFLLRPKGKVYVFAGYAKLPEHVNILSLEEIRDDFKSAGFKIVGKIGHPKTGDYLQIFEK